MVRYNAYRIIHEADVSHKSKRTYHMLLTSENTAGSTNTAAENNCNSFILDNRLSSCRYEIYEPLLSATPPSWVGELLLIKHTSLCRESWVSFTGTVHVYAKEVSFYLLHKLLTDGITTSFLSVAVVCVT